MVIEPYDDEKLEAIEWRRAYEAAGFNLVPVARYFKSL